MPLLLAAISDYPSALAAVPLWFLPFPHFRILGFVSDFGLRISGLPQRWAAGALVWASICLVGGGGGAVKVCKPRGNWSDSSQSASKCSSAPVNPTVELRANESRVGLDNSTEVTELVSLGERAATQGRPAVYVILGKKSICRLSCPISDQPATQVRVFSQSYATSLGLA